MTRSKPPTRRRQWLGSIWIALLWTTAATADPIRYRFEPGDVLVYRVEALRSTAAGGGIPKSPVEVRIWCLDARDEQFLLLVEGRWESPNQPPLSEGILVWITATGERSFPPEMLPLRGAFDEALHTLPILPLPVQSAEYWRTAPDTFGVQMRCRAHGADAARFGHLRIEWEADDTGCTHDLLDIRQTGTVWLDAQQGHVTRAEVETRSGIDQARQTLRFALAESLHRTPAWAARRTTESRQFVLALRHEARLLDAMVRPPADAADVLAKLDRVWAGFVSDVSDRADSPFHAIGLGRQRRFRNEANRLRARVALTTRWIDQPARPWSLQDANGRLHTSEQSRRGVTIECLWSSETVWGPRAMPAFRALMQAKTTWPVEVLVINLDTDFAAARRAVQTCGSDLPQLMGGPLHQATPLPELPIVRVIDERGIVRAMWIGWRPDYDAAVELAESLARPKD